MHLQARLLVSSLLLICQFADARPERCETLAQSSVSASAEVGIDRYQLTDGQYQGTPLASTKRTVRWARPFEVAEAKDPQYISETGSPVQYIANLRGNSATEFYLGRINLNEIESIVLLIQALPNQQYQHAMLEFKMSHTGSVYLMPQTPDSKQGTGPHVQMHQDPSLRDSLLSRSLYLSATPLVAGLTDVPVVNKYGKLSGLVYMMMTDASFAKYLTKNGIPEVRRFQINADLQLRKRIFIAALRLSEERGGKFQFTESNNCASSISGVFESAMKPLGFTPDERTNFDEIKNRGAAMDRVLCMLGGVQFLTPMISLGLQDVEEK